MKFVKYLLALVFAFCAFTSITNAQNVKFLGGGSSALFQELGQASYNAVNVPAGTGCLWTSGTTTVNPPAAGTDYFAARDARVTVPAIPNNGDENGKLFIAWNQNGSGNCAAPTAGYNVYAYMQLDSVIGNRCYFENDGSGHTGCLLIGILNGAVGANQINTQADVPAASQLPAGVLAALKAGATLGHFFVAGTDIRPEDAVFGTQRALAPCNTLILRQFFNNTSYALLGLGYQNGPNIGVQIQGDPAYGAGVFNVVNFGIIAGAADPVSGAAIPASAVTTIGAQPELVIVGPTTDGAVAQMTDITNYTLSQYYAGNLGRTNDLFGVNVAEAMNFLVREPLSGTWSVFEYSNPQSTQFHTGQETGNCNAGGTVLQNPMHLATIPGVFGGAVNRIRSIGTSNIYKFVDAAPNGTPVLGYAFWSSGNVAALKNTKYLKVNGIDPLESQIGTPPAGCPNPYAYTGVVPGSAEVGAPAATCVTFNSLNAGDYPIWSPLRLVGAPGDPNIAAMITNLTNLNNLQNDYIKPAVLAIWHSHFQINGQPANSANGPTFCVGGVVEGGGDAGGSTMLGINDTHFCADLGTTVGKLNLTF
jgi:hypothetical protein